MPWTFQLGSAGDLPCMRCKWKDSHGADQRSDLLRGTGRGIVPLLMAKQEYSFLNEAHWIPKSTASYYVDLKLLLVGSNHTLKFTWHSSPFVFLFFFAYPFILSASVSFAVLWLLSQMVCDILVLTSFYVSVLFLIYFCLCVWPPLSTSPTLMN